MWRPISEYPTDPLKAGPVVLARDDQGCYFLVCLYQGNFHIVPGHPIYYGNMQVGWLYANHVKEFMEIPK